MFKRFRASVRRTAILKSIKARTFLKTISKKINIKEQFPRLLQQYKQLQRIHSKSRPKPLYPRCPVELTSSSTPRRPRPSTSSAGCEEPDLGPDPNLGHRHRPCLKRSRPKSTPGKLLRRHKRRRGRKRKSSAKSLKYLGLYHDIRFRVKHASTEPVNPVETTILGKVSLDFPIGPAKSKILPEGVMKYFPGKLSDLQTVKIRSLREYMKVKKRKPTKYDRLLFQRRTNIKREDPPNLFVGKTLVVVVRVYWPSFEKPRYVRRRLPPKLSQVIVMLGSQTLDQLRDKIRCTADMIVPKDCCKDPRNAPTNSAKDVYKSGCFFINDAFYNDMRDPANIDYSEVLRKWLMQKGLGHFDSYKMETTKMQDLTVQLGRAYVYQHQGSCEHILAISDIRLLNGSEPQYLEDYPYVAYESRRRAKLCYMCARYPARWMTVHCGRVPYNPSYFCDKCFYSYNYVGNKNAGEFQAYSFTQPFYIP